MPKGTDKPSEVERVKAELQEAMDDLERRGVVTSRLNEHGKKLYTFPDLETGKRLLRESAKPQ